MQINVFHSGSSGNLYRIDDGHTPLLIECGVPVREIKQVLGFKLHEIRACLVSHSHKDHCAAVEDVMHSGIDCYMSRETAEALSLQGHCLHILEPLETVSIGSWQCLPFPTEHDAEGSLGFLLASGGEKLLYITDSYFVHYRFQGITHVMVEANWSEETIDPDLHPAVRKRLLRSHMSLENCIRLLQANDLSRVREIYLIHISEGNGDPGLFRRLVQETTGKPVYIKE